MSEPVARRVLSLCAQNRREMVRKAISNESFKIAFVSSLPEVTAAMTDFQPTVFVHDWQCVDESQSQRFHIKLSQSSTSVDLVRIILVPEVLPKILAFASDAGIDKVVSYGTASLNLGNEIGMMLDSKESSELQRLVKESRVDTFRYNQKEVDKKIDDLFARFPHDARVKLEFGNLSLRRDQFQEAARLADDLLKKDGNNLRAMNLLSRAKMKLGHWDEALQLLNSAVILSPQNPERLIMIGDALYGKGDLDQALKAYQGAAAMDPDVANQANRGIGQIKLDQGHIEEALELFKSSVSEEEAAGFFNNAAVQAARKEQFDEALKLYESALKALKSDKLKPTIYYNIALTHLRLHRKVDAEKALRRSLHYNPNHEKAKQLMEKLRI